MRDYTTNEKLKVIAGAVTALVIVGVVAFALALMSGGPERSKQLVPLRRN